MSQIERREYFIDQPLSPKLFLQSWLNKDKETKGVVLITHGIAEHSECYNHLGQALAEDGWATFAWDLQGHGKSQGKRGYVHEFADFWRDLHTIIKEIKDEQSIKSSPFVLFGHSMGGLITMRALLDEDHPPVDAVVLSSPAMGIAMEVPQWKDAAAKWLNQVWPTFTMSNDVQHNRLSRDPKMVASYKKDPLRHAKVSAPIYLGILDSQDYVNENIERFKIPVFCQLAGNDKITDTNAALEIYKQILSPKKLKIYEDSYHEIYNDINKQDVIADLKEYLGEINND